MIRLRYNGKRDRDFDMTGKPEVVGELIELTRLDSHYIYAPATIFKKDGRLAGNLNCFDYVPAIVPDNVTHLTEEELVRWQTQAKQKYLMHLDTQAYQENYP